jgi:hypothetical protein
MIIFYDYFIYRYMNLVQPILKDLGYSFVATFAVEALNLDDKIRELIPAKGDNMIAIGLADGAVNYFSGEVLDYFVEGKVPDVISMNFRSALDNYLYFTGCAVLGSIAKVDEMFAGIVVKLPLPPAQQATAITAATMTAARIGRQLINATNPNSAITHPTNVMYLPVTAVSTASGSSMGSFF